jgi:hypothetical protein
MIFILFLFLSLFQIVHNNTGLLEEVNFSSRKYGRWDKLLIVILLEWLECVEHFSQYQNASLK